MANSHLLIQLINVPAEDAQYLRVEEVPLARHDDCMRQLLNIYPTSQIDVLYFQDFDERARRIRGFANSFCCGRTLLYKPRGAIFRIAQSNALFSLNVVRQLIEDRDVDAWVRNRSKENHVVMVRTCLPEANEPSLNMPEGHPRVWEIQVTFLYTTKLPATSTWIVSKQALVQACMMVVNTVDSVDSEELQAAWAAAEKPDYVQVSDKGDFFLNQTEKLSMTLGHALWILKTLTSGTKWDSPVDLYNTLRKEDSSVESKVKFPYKLVGPEDYSLYWDIRTDKKAIPSVTARVFSALTDQVCVVERLDQTIVPIEFTVQASIKTDEHERFIKVLGDLVDVLKDLQFEDDIEVCKLISTVLDVADQSPFDWINQVTVKGENIFRKRRERAQAVKKEVDFTPHDLMPDNYGNFMPFSDAFKNPFPGSSLPMEFPPRAIATDAPQRDAPLTDIPPEDVSYQPVESCN